MAEHYRELLEAAALLVTRQPGQPPPTDGQVRRSISTSYYALFQFLIDDCMKRLIGDALSLQHRRYILARAVTHKGLADTLRNAATAHRKTEMNEFLLSDAERRVAPATLTFLSKMALTFEQVQVQRHGADYDLNRIFVEIDAFSLITVVEDAITAWLAADTPADRDLKHAVSLLILLKGKLRATDA